MKPLEGRITALERVRKKALPEYTLTLENGAEANIDALDAILYAAQLQAGKEGIQRLKSLKLTRGELPAAGTIWEDLKKYSG